jgi:hypothetical protein
MLVNDDVCRGVIVLVLPPRVISHTVKCAKLTLHSCDDDALMIAVSTHACAALLKRLHLDHARSHMRTLLFASREVYVRSEVEKRFIDSCQTRNDKRRTWEGENGTGREREGEGENTPRNGERRRAGRRREERKERVRA